jgi:hypothetical protein
VVLQTDVCVGGEGLHVEKAEINIVNDGVEYKGQDNHHRRENERPSQEYLAAPQIQSFRMK